jgi:hypothetical protein
LLQSEVASEHVPPFCAIDPFADDPVSELRINYPFWLKPVKAVLSHLGFRIDNELDFRAAIPVIRRDIGRYAEPFNLILSHAELPPEIATIEGHHCIAEGIISSGRQVTQEGYVFNGKTTVYGTVDSLRCGPQGSSFSRYQYPSALPPAVLAQMAEITARVMTRIGYDGGPFNIEYFWDEPTGAISLLEINPRISKSHAPLFRMVDGCYHHQVMVDLGLGREPCFAQGAGHCALAAKFMVRQFHDAIVSRAPTPAEIATVQSAVPDTQIQLAVQEGQRLSSLWDQDSYSYEVATIFVGGDNEAQVEQRFRDCLRQLPLALEPVDGTPRSGT